MAEHQCNARLGPASIRFDGEVLTASTGEIERQWQWTGRGFATASLRRLATERNWVPGLPAHACDWIPPGCETGSGPSRLIGVTAEESDDEGFTSPHLCATCEMEYPEDRLAVRLVVWCYPEAPGLRTQLWVRGLSGYEPDGTARTSRRAEYIPAEVVGARRRLIGYYNDTQNRNDTHLHLLEEQVETRRLSAAALYRWPSALCLEADGEGLAAVQESHKCVNQRGHDTGAFRLDPATGLESDGWGVLPGEVRLDRWRPAWARWVLAYGNTDTQRQVAFKSFDRLRYPLDPGRDLYTQANTWGSTRPGPEARDAARAENVLREIDSQADLGIDVQQIDDGWQGNQYGTYRPDPARYPKGWGPVVKRARQRGVGLGLWAAAQRISLEELQASWDEAGFRQYKLDFVNLRSHDDIEALVQKVRSFVLHTGHRVRVNWDVTENAPRFGYWWAREYGSVYLANRKDRHPEWVVYRPHTVLRDAWDLARYVNLTRFQVAVQNAARTDGRYSDAPAHSQAYCTAIALMATPLFFHETQHYGEEGRDQIRDLLARYRPERERMAEGIVFPIGERPDGARWTGFQCHRPETGDGYLLLFRELYSPTSEGRFALHCIRHAEMAVTDLRTGSASTAALSTEGALTVTLDQPGDFLFWRYAT